MIIILLSQVATYIAKADNGIYKLMSTCFVINTITIICITVTITETFAIAVVLQ